MAAVKTGILVAGTAVNVTVEAAVGIWLTNITGTGRFFVRFDGTTATIRGDDCYPVIDRRYRKAKGSVTVSLISDASLEYSVEGTD